jgi:hypothetical protein
MRKQRMQRLRILHSSLAGVALIIVSQLLQVGHELDNSLCLRTSIICFAIAIPALAATTYVLTIEVDYDQHPSWNVTLGIPGRQLPIEWPWGRKMWVVSVLGLLSGYIGIAAMFFYFGRVAGVLFLALSVFTFYGASQHDRLRHAPEAPRSD